MRAHIGTLERGFGARGFSTGALVDAVCFLLDAVMVSRTLVALSCGDEDANGFPDPLTCSFKTQHNHFSPDTTCI